MKTILIPTEDHAFMPAVLQSARLIAQHFGSYMEGFAVYPAASDFVAVDPVSSLTIASMQEGGTGPRVGQCCPVASSCRQGLQARQVFPLSAEVPKERLGDFPTCIISRSLPASNLERARYGGALI